MSPMRMTTAFLLAIALSAPASAQITYERLLDAESEPENWLTYTGDYSSQSFISSGRVARPVHLTKEGYDNRDQIVGRFSSNSSTKPSPALSLDTPFSWM